ncbi:hypothetical protein [Arenibaculum pallidiluteum]|uniref:hypothetical protein n=1 Tax=Arenibaculum pallidiluteum TaxID=2812559 RepID=UPI001A96A489|nr:hypothetical protein [Arenibaculum pallidiluteum]
MIDRDAASALSTYETARLEGAEEVVAIQAAVSELCEEHSDMTPRDAAKVTARAIIDRNTGHQA